MLFRSSPPASLPRNQKERNQQRTQAWKQANQALKQQRAAALPTSEKTLVVSLSKQVTAARVQVTTARAKTKAARMSAQKTLDNALHSLGIAQSQYDQARFGSRSLLMHYLNLITSLNSVEGCENRYDKAARSEYPGDKNPIFFQDKTECYVCEGTKKLPRPVRRAERYGDCCEGPDNKKLPLVIEKAECRETIENTELSHLQVQERDGRFENTGNETNATQRLRETMEDTWPHWRLVGKLRKDVDNAEQGIHKARWALRKARVDERDRKSVV